MTLIRKNIRMSSNIAEWYEDKAKELGVSQTNLMVMALSDYIKQDNAINVMGSMDGVIKQLNKLKEENPQK